MATKNEVRADAGGYAALLADGGFHSFLWTQFLAAFNDNVYKMIVSVGAVELAANQLLGSRYLAIAGAIFVLPFLLFAGYAGQLADRFSKTRVLQITKAFEILIMGVGMVALYAGSIHMLLAVLFLLAMQANFFSPAKYGILPEMLSEAQLSRANGLLESESMRDLLAAELRRRKAASDLKGVLDKIRSAPGDPLSEEEIDAEVKAARSERRAREAGR